MPSYSVQYEKRKKEKTVKYQDTGRKTTTLWYESISNMKPHLSQSQSIMIACILSRRRRDKGGARVMRRKEKQRRKENAQPQTTVCR
jgi:hypothetical protein